MSTASTLNDCFLFSNNLFKKKSITDFKSFKRSNRSALCQHDLLKTDSVVVDLLEVFVDGVVTRQHGDGREGQVEHHQGQHVGHVVPAGSSRPRTKLLHHHRHHVGRH